MFLQQQKSQSFNPYTVIECELPENYENGQIFSPNGTFFNSQLEFVCNKGYRLDGPKTLTCLESGQWSELLPACLRS